MNNLDLKISIIIILTSLTGALWWIFENVSVWISDLICSDCSFFYAGFFIGLLVTFITLTLFFIVLPTILIWKYTKRWESVGDIKTDQKQRSGILTLYLIFLLVLSAFLSQ